MESYKTYDFMTTDDSFNVGDIVAVQPGIIAYVSHYTIEQADLRGSYKWVIGKVDFDEMDINHCCKLWDSGINKNTGKPFKSLNWQNWNQELKDTEI
jgi:hypothetical protein